MKLCTECFRHFTFFGGPCALCCVYLPEGGDEWYADYEEVE